MSTSTVSVTANTAAAARRRPVVIGEKKSGLDLVGSDGIATSPGNDKVISGEIGKDLSHSIRGETVLERSRDAIQLKKSTLPPNSTAPLPRRSAARKAASKPEKPRWQTVVSVFTKNFLLLLVLLLLAQMIRRLALNSNTQESGVITVPSSDYEGRLAEMESFLKTATKMMQVQVEVVDRKIENEIAGLRNAFGRKIEENGLEFSSQLNKLDARVQSVEKLVGDKDWLAKDDFEKFVEEFKKAKGADGDNGDVSLDEVRAFAKEIVEKEIEKHAADGLGMVDYALASGGAMVVKHSEPFFAGKVISWLSRNGVHSDAGKMLRPSFGQPGDCFPLKGSSGFVNIKLRTAIVPEAITLEHVAKSVAYDRSSAPKECRVYGWLGGLGVVDATGADSQKMVLLTEFTYDLEKTNAQTFKVLESGSGVVDRIMLDFASNHGSPTHTCIYRLRVHGHEPKSVPTLTVQS